jgi:hypothetical protein
VRLAEPLGQQQVLLTTHSNSDHDPDGANASEGAHSKCRKLLFTKAEIGTQLSFLSAYIHSHIETCHFSQLTSPPHMRLTPTASERGLVNSCDCHLKHAHVVLSNTRVGQSIVGRGGVPAVGKQIRPIDHLHNGLSACRIPSDRPYMSAYSDSWNRITTPAHHPATPM